MIYWTVVFLIIAIIAGILGFGDIAAEATAIAKVVFMLFIILFIVSALFGFMGRRRRDENL